MALVVASMFGTLYSQQSNSQRQLYQLILMFICAYKTSFQKKSTVFQWQDHRAIGMTLTIQLTYSVYRLSHLYVLYPTNICCVQTIWLNWVVYKLPQLYAGYKLSSLNVLGTNFPTYISCVQNIQLTCVVYKLPNLHALCTN
jgi:hypothetical protein